MNKAKRIELMQALDIINAVKDEEQEAFDNLPESLQGGEQGLRMASHIADLEECADLIEGVTE